MKNVWRVWLVPLVLCTASSIALGAESGTALSLKTVVSRALESNPEIQRLNQRVQALQARAKQAPYLEDPEIALQFDAVPLSNPIRLDRSDSNSIGIRQKLPFFGKLGLQEKIAIQEANVGEQELRAREREIVSQVKMVYADLFMNQRAIEIANEQLEIVRVVTRATEARYQVGRVTQQDVFKSLLEQSEIMNQLLTAEQERKSAEVKLNVLMNEPPQNRIDVPQEISTPDVITGLSEAERLALTNRPELQGAEREIERTEAMYDLAEKNRKYPDFMVGLDYTRMPTETTKNRYSTMVNITIPFSPWTAGKRTYEVEGALAEVRAAKANRDAVRNMTFRDIEDLRAKVDAAAKSIKLFREGILPQAELSFRASLSAYQAGRVEFASLLDAQRSLRDARMGFYKSQVRLIQSLADLERVIGTELQ